MLDQIVTVVENRALTGGHLVLGVRSPQQARAARPGQFAMIRLLGHSDVLLRRPMSIYDVKAEPNGKTSSLHGSEWEQAADSAQSPSVLEFLYKVVGRGTGLMSRLKPGDEVGLLAPLGHGFFAEEFLAEAREADEVVYLAGGIGIAALLLPARELAQAGVKQRLLFGGRTDADLVGVAEFEPYVTSITLATENGSRGHRGYVTTPFEDCLREHSGRRFVVLACGPWAMLEAAVAICNRYHQRCLVSMENRMGCALGVCLGCSIRVRGEGHAAYERVCTEGPVFWSEHVLWGAEKGL